MDIYLIADLAFGDSGKGSVTDFLVRETKANLVVRYNGGPQAAHNVVTPEGVHHTFAQFGSGSLIPGVDTYLSKYMLIEPRAFLNERQELFSKIDHRPTVFVHEDCNVITPYDWIMNRAKERKLGDKRYGSCGMGVGEARRRQFQGGPVLTAGDLYDSYRRKKILDDIHAMWSVIGMRYYWPFTEEDLLHTYDQFCESIRLVDDEFMRRQYGSVVFEGAQGVLLDETHGFAPYNTWTDTTFNNAYKVLDGARVDRIERIGLLRTVFTRHGPGPFPSEGLTPPFTDHNTTGPWQGPFRKGQFDLILARYALDVIGGVDCIAMSHCDLWRSGPSIPCVSKYETKDKDGNRHVITRLRKPDTDLLLQCKPAGRMHLSVQGIADYLGTEVGIVSHGPTARDKSRIPVGIPVLS